MTIAASAPVRSDRPARWPSLANVGRIGFVALVAVAAAGCSSNGDEGTTSQDELSSAWVLPDAVAEIGSQVDIPYESPGHWNGGRGCSGKFREGSRALGRELMTRFGQIPSIGGYSCRQNTANAAMLSVHGTGKALDIFIPMKGGRANSDLGDPVANWLIVHASEIGVQYIIWNHTQWRANGSNLSPYHGPVPHIDHIHAEITEKAANLEMPFFNRLVSQGPVADQGLTAPNEQQPAAGDISVFGNNGNATANQPPAEVITGQQPDVEDTEPGERDSLGTGTRNEPESETSPTAKPVVGGCAAAPVGTGDAGFGAFAALVAATLVARRRRR